jgi:hypothetical protein
MGKRGFPYDVPFTQNNLQAPVLALTELETPPGAGLAVLLPFHHPGIPGKETVVPEAGIVSLVYLTEGPGKAVAAGAGLAVYAAAIDVYQYIKFIFSGGYHQGLTHHQGMFTQRKVLIQFPAVDDYPAVSVPDIYPGY